MEELRRLEQEAALGYTALAADGLGGVQSAGEAEGSVSRWVVDRDEGNKTVTILL